MTWTNQLHDRDARQWAKALLLFLLSGSCVFDGFIPLNDLIIIIIIMIFTVIVPYFYLLLCCKSIRNILQREKSIFDCLITHILCFKVIGDIFQLPWVYLNSFFARPLCFKAVRDTMKCIRNGTHYLVAHPLRPKMIRNK